MALGSGRQREAVGPGGGVAGGGVSTSLKKRDQKRPALGKETIHNNRKAAVSQRVIATGLKAWLMHPR